MSDTLRSLAFGIGFEIGSSDLTKADKQVDIFKEGVLGSDKAIKELGFEVKDTSKEMVKGFSTSEKAIDKVGDEAKETAKGLGKIGDESEKASKKGQKAFDKLENTLKNIGKVTMAAVGVAFITIGGLAIDAGMKADESFKIIRVGTGATGEALDGLLEVYKSVAKNTDESLTDVAQVVADLNTRTGAAGKSLESLASTILDLGDIAKEDFSSLSTSVTRAMGDWGVAVENGTDLMDKLFITSQSTGIGVSSLADKLVQFGAPLRQMGFGLEESMAMLGKFEKEGVNTELVLGSMRIALGKMASEGIKDPAEGLATLIDLIQDTKDAGTATAIAMEYFGARSGPDMAAAIREGRFEVGDLILAINDSKGAISENANETQTFIERMAQLKNQASLALQPVGIQFLDIADRILPKVLDGIEDIGVFLEESGPQVETFANTAISLFNGFANAIGFVVENANISIPILGGLLASITAFKIISTINTLMALWKTTTLATTTAQTGLNVALSANPIGLIVMGIGLAVAAGIALWQNWDIIKEKAFELWEGIRPVFEAIGKFVVGVFSSAWEGIKNNINFITGGINLLIRAINKIGFDIPDWVPGLGGKKFAINIPEIPMLAKGTDNFAGGLAITSEEGPELLNLPRGTSVTPNNKTEQLLNSGTSHTFAPQVNIQIIASGENAQDISKEVNKELERQFIPFIEDYFKMLSKKRDLMVEI